MFMNVVSFSSHARIWGGRSDSEDSFPAGRSVRTHQFYCSGQDQSTVAQKTETTVAECPLTIACELVSPIDSHIMPEQHSQTTPTSWSKQSGLPMQPFSRLPTSKQIVLFHFRCYPSQRTKLIKTYLSSKLTPYKNNLTPATTIFFLLWIIILKLSMTPSNTTLFPP